MRKIKIFPYNQSYIRIQNTHIFLNFDRDDLNFLNTINPASIRKIHVFLTHPNSITQSLQVLIEKYSDKSTFNVSVSIHIPLALKQLRELLRQILAKKTLDNHRFNIMVRRVKEVSFWSRRETFPFDLSFRYYKDHMKLLINSNNRHNNKKNVGVEYPDFYYEGPDCDVEGDKVGIFETADMRVNPEKFKSELIENFKKSLDGKFNPFNTDEEIWDYIMEQGEWKVESVEDVPAGSKPQKHSQEAIDFGNKVNAALKDVYEDENLDGE